MTAGDLKPAHHAGGWNRAARRKRRSIRATPLIGLLAVAGCATDNPALFHASVPPPPVHTEAAAPIQTKVATRSGPTIRPDSIKNNKIGLADAVTLIIQRHPDIMQANAVLARSKADVGTAESVWYPQLSYQAGLGPNTFNGSSTSSVNSNVQGPGVALNQQVWDFGRSAGAIGSAKATQSQRSQEVVVTADKLAEKGALAFLDVKRYEALASAAAKNTVALKELRSRIQDRVTAGTSDQSDLMLADVRIEGALGEEIRAKSSLMAAKVLLATLIGGMVDRYDDPAPAISKLAIHKEEPAFDQLPAVAAADQAEKAATAKIKQTKAEIYPQLGVQLGYNRNNYT